jgi:hypothetical protein
MLCHPHPRAIKKLPDLYNEDVKVKSQLAQKTNETGYGHEFFCKDPWVRQ